MLESDQNVFSCRSVITPVTGGAGGYKFSSKTHLYTSAADAITKLSF